MVVNDEGALLRDVVKSDPLLAVVDPPVHPPDSRTQRPRLVQSCRLEICGGRERI